MRDLLLRNKVLSSLNIADNRIGNDGLAVVSQAFGPSCVLVILNLSNNDLEGTPVMEAIQPYLRKTRNLLELNLSNNRIGDCALTRLSEIFKDNSSRLQRLSLANCELTSASMSSFFIGVRSSTHLRSLNLSHNDLSGH